MSEMQQLFNKVSEDQELQLKFFSITKNAEQADPETVRNKLLEFAKNLGFEVGIEEMEAFFKELSEESDRELSDSELDMVAGGKSTGYIITIVVSAVGAVFTAGAGFGPCWGVANSLESQSQEPFNSVRID